MMVTRSPRSYLKRLLMLAVLLCFSYSFSHASAPMVKKSAPGYSRFMLGDFEITVLSDGTLEVPVDKALTNIAPAQVTERLHRFFREDAYEMSVNSYLINTGPKLILIDAGAGSLLGPTLGKLLKNLQESGYRADQVDEVYLTHMHEDHVGGLMSEGKRAFPNAVVRADEAEADFWFSKERLAAARPELRKFFPEAIEATSAYVQAGMFKPFQAGAVLTPGIRAESAYGHTAGSTIYIVESRGEQLQIWGDLLHVEEIQLLDPGVTIGFDSDPAAAAAQRRRRLAEAATKGYLIGAAHISFPGVGRIRPSGVGYSWLPLPYSVIR